MTKKRVLPLKINDENFDIDSFFDEEFDIEDTDTELDDATANYYISRIKRNREMKKEYTDKAKEITKAYSQKIKVWEQKHQERIDNDIEYCLGRLRSYFDQHSKGETDKIRLPEGNIGFYSKPQSIDIDEDALMEIISSDDNMAKEFITYTPKLNTKAIRKEGTVDTDFNFYLNGILMPSVKVNPSTKVFNVR